MFSMIDKSTSTSLRDRLLAELQPLWRFAMYLTRDRHEAEDLVQRTCLRALEKSHQYSDAGNLRSWLFRMAQNVWFNELRSRKIRDRSNFNPSHPNDNPSGLPFQQRQNIGPYESLQDEQSALYDVERIADPISPDTNLELDDIYRAVEALPEAQRLVMILISVEGFTYSETAEALEIPIGTVMSRLARARLSIGRHFQQNGILSDSNYTKHRSTPLRPV